MSQSKLPLTLKTYSVLPDNRSPLERALELALSEALYSIDHPYPELLNAQKTPKGVITTLGIDRQVPVWDSTDTEQVKRDRTQQAWRNRQLSGTRAGFIKALGQMGFGADVTPWFKKPNELEPYYFQIWVYAADRVLTPEINARIDQLLTEMKSERDSYVMDLARESISTPRIAVAAEIGITMTSTPFVPAGSETNALTHTGIAQHLRIISTSEPARNE
ncbi:phage tail protein I [Marinomonas sp. FW-1]|uniref:phage tail protein I n=1 Tax=Marinomonas sp. FW-1 TaxID=2071621 RepID=UPI00158693DB|nr:phage tail protein I [Marinomonas sp. FW-1]